MFCREQKQTFVTDVVGKTVLEVVTVTFYHLSVYRDPRLVILTSLDCVRVADWNGLAISASIYQLLSG